MKSKIKNVVLIALGLTLFFTAQYLAYEDELNHANYMQGDK